MRKLMSVVLISGFLTACASAPMSSDLEGIPVVKFGGSVPEGKDFILHFRAGEPVRTRVKIRGNLFEKEATEELSVKLKRDIYAYRNWISYDRKTWIDGNSALGVKLDLKIPGPDHPRTGLIDLQMFTK